MSGTTATLTGDAAGEVPPDALVIERNGALLTHNRSGTDPGFAGETDFDSSTAGAQTISDGPAATVVVNAGAGADSIAIGGSAGPASAIAANFSLDGGTGVDYLNVDDEQDTSARNVVLTASQVSGFRVNPILHTGIENSSLMGGSGADRLTVADEAPSAVLYGNGGDDAFVLHNGVVLYGAVIGGAGSDVLDMSAFAAPATVNLGTEAVLGGFLNGGQEVPPTASNAWGYANLYLDRLTGLFDLYVTVSGIAQADLTTSHLHAGAPGANGAPFFDTGAGSQWESTGGDLVRNMDDATFPQARLADLLAGNTYFNVHSSAFPDGEIRGQVTLNSYDGRAGSDYLSSIERVIGGSAADTLTGNPLANRLEGRGGNDTLIGDDGADDLIGGAGADRLRGQDGNDVLRAQDGAADLELDCGPGTGDVAGRDAASVDADGILAGCETVQTSAVGGGGSTGGTVPGGVGPVQLGTVVKGTISSIRAKLVAARRGALVLLTRSRASCPAAARSSCRIRANAVTALPRSGARGSARARKATLGGTSFLLRPGTSRAVTIKLSRSKSRLLRRLGKARVTIGIAVSTPGGSTARRKRTLALRVPAA